MTQTTKAKESAYDRYIDYRRFSIAVAAFVLLIALPVPEAHLGTEI